MKTTVEFADDLVEAIVREQPDGVSFQDMVERLLRRALADQPAVFDPPSFPLGFRGTTHCSDELLEAADTEPSRC
ncbi:MAG: hypothetical protein ACKVVT_11295 [Dehalococcoidia bacterium]